MTKTSSSSMHLDAFASASEAPALHFPGHNLSDVHLDALQPADHLDLSGDLTTIGQLFRMQLAADF